MEAEQAWLPERQKSEPGSGVVSQSGWDTEAGREARPGHPWGLPKGLGRLFSHPCVCFPKSSCKPLISSKGYAWHCFPGAVRGQSQAHPPTSRPPFWEGRGATWPGDQGVLSPGYSRQLLCSSSSELRERSGWQEGTPGCLASYRALHTSRTRPSGFRDSALGAELMCTYTGQPAHFEDGLQVPS